MRRVVMVVALVLVAGIAAGVLLYPRVACAQFLQGVGGEWIAFERDDGLYVMDMQGNGQCKIADDGMVAAAWSPDGTQLAYVSDVDDALYLMRADGSGREMLADDSATLNSLWVRPAWSPDGTQIVYTVGIDGTEQTVLTLVDVASGERRALTETAGMPSWSPDGSLIAFMTLDDRLMTIRPDGTDETERAAEIETNRAPAWSPDSTRLLYVALGTFDLTVLTLSDGSTEVLELDNGATVSLPYSLQWSPDGSLIGARLAEIGEHDVYTIDPQLGTLRVVALGGAGLDVAWSPDGESLIYSNGTDPQSDDRAIYAVDVRTRAVRRLAAGNSPVVGK